MITQAELKKMARFHERWLEGKPGGQWADFSGQELTHLDFDGMDFETASFRGAKISNCYLCGNFTHGGFRGAEIRDSFTGHCSFESADFTDASCYFCDFTRAQFDGAHLRRALFDNCDFTHAKLECCDMTAARFKNTVFHWTATAGSWGETPPARDAETVLAEGNFIAAMLGLDFEDEEKISEWMDEAWSQAQDRDCEFEPEPEPREPKYREILVGYAAAFVQAQEQYPAAAETLYNHGELFSPEELLGAVEYISNGGSLEAACHIEWQSLFRPEKADDLAILKEVTEQVIGSAASGTTVFHLDDIEALHGMDVLYEPSLHDMLLDREEVAEARWDLNENTITMELKPEFLSEQSAMAMQM